MLNGSLWVVHRVDTLRQTSDASGMNGHHLEMLPPLLVVSSGATYLDPCLLLLEKYHLLASHKILCLWGPASGLGTPFSAVAKFVHTHTHSHTALLHNTYTCSPLIKLLPNEGFPPLVIRLIPFLRTCVQAPGISLIPSHPK